MTVDPLRWRAPVVRLLSVLAFLVFVGPFVAVKEKIDESVQTDVAVDALGDPHLTEKATGKDITVKADGVVAGTTPRVSLTNLIVFHLTRHST